MKKPLTETSPHSGQLGPPSKVDFLCGSITNLSVEDLDPLL